MENIYDTADNTNEGSLIIHKGLRETISHDEQGEKFHVPEAQVMALSKTSERKRKTKIFKREKKEHIRNIDYLVSEQFKALKIRLFHTQNGNLPRTLLIASALPSEGKSMVATNLAISIAQGVREHVLLVDCDFRKPTLHKLLGMAPEKGLADYLSGNADLSEIFLKTKIPKLTLMSVGEKPSNPVDLLASVKMKHLMEELRDRYEDRYIIFDSSPIQLTTEPMVLLSQVEGVIMVVKAGKTNREILLRIIQDIEKKKLLGVVLNGLEKSLSNSYYYNYYYY